MSLIYSCNKKTEVYKSEIDLEINNTNSIEQQKQVLAKIFENSQKVVEEIDSLEKNFFKNRGKVQEWRIKRDSLAKINNYRVEEYLNKFPYPSSEKFSKEETLAIYYAIVNDFQKNGQLKYFQILEKAYQDGNISKHHYFNYLYKLYYLVYGKLYRFDKRHSIEEMIVDITPLLVKAN